MSRKRVFLAALLAMVLVPAATAGTVDFLFVGGSWSWAGGLGSTMNISSTTAFLTSPGFTGPVPLGVLNLSLTSGGATGGDGGASTPFTWGAGGSITISGLCSPCFTGSFTAAQAGFNGTGGMTFVGSFVEGAFDPAFQTAILGVSLGYPQFAGLIHIDISPAPVSFAAGGEGAVNSGDLNLNPVPEPGTLAMFGSGLIGLAGVLRRKLSI